MSVSALLWVVATATSTPATSEARRIFIFPAVTHQTLVRGTPVGPATLRTFDAAFAAQAAARWLERGYETISGAGAQTFLPPGGCDAVLCADAARRASYADLWVSAVLVQKNERDCRARAVLYDPVAERARIEAEADIAPCVPGNLFAGARALADRVSLGPARSPPRALELSAARLPSLGVPDVPAISALSTSTRARALTGLSLDEALALYQRRAFVLVEAAGGRYRIARGDRVTTDCEVLEGAEQGLSGDLRARCEGNAWEWGWLLVPTGAALMGLSAGDLGQQQVSLGFLVGAVVSATGAALALALNRDAADFADGEHVVSRALLEAAIVKHNARLRRTLALSAADVASRGAPR